MPMNIVIQEQRKLLGLTQEQVADYLGVSTPAVSKWEKGITSPDIGLLPPLARLLKIDLNTLFCFSEDLSEQEIGFFCNELAKQAGMIFFLHLMLLKQRYTNTHTTNCFFSTSRLFWIPYFCRQPMILYPSIALIQRFQTGIYIWLRAMMKRYEIVLTI